MKPNQLGIFQFAKNLDEILIMHLLWLGKSEISVEFKVLQVTSKVQIKPALKVSKLKSNPI